MIGERIREVRLRRLGLTQRELAYKLVSRNGNPPDQVNISRWELGASEPSIRYVRQLAELADLPISWFYEEDKEAVA